MKYDYLDQCWKLLRVICRTIDFLCTPFIISSCLITGRVLIDDLPTVLCVACPQMPSLAVLLGLFYVTYPGRLFLEKSASPQCRTTAETQ